MKNWQEVKLSDICELNIGGTPSRSEDSYWNGSYNWVSISDLSNLSNLIITETKEKITDDGVKNSNVKLVEKGTVLLSFKLSLGKIAITGKDLFTNEAIVALPIKNKEQIDSYFLLYFLKQIDWVNFGQKAVKGNCLNKEILKDIIIKYPPLEEQKRIAKILSKCDRIRRTRQYSLQLSDTYLQSVFLEMFGKFLTLDTKSKLKDILEIPLSNGAFTKNENYGFGTPIIWVDNLYHTNSIDISNLRKASFDNISISKYEVLEGDLLFTRSSLVREGTGQINIVPKLEEKTLFECHIIRARINKNKANPYYILGLYRSKYGRNLIMQRANTGTMTTIGQEALQQLLCPLPPLPLQEKFAKIVQKFDRFRNQQREAQRQSDHLFQTLLHQAFTGEL